MKDIINSWNIQPFLEKYISTGDSYNVFENSICLDYTKHYENTLLELTEDIAVPCCLDYMTECEEKEELNNYCYYYVETDNYLPFRKSGWYCYEFLKRILKLKSTNLQTSLLFSSTQIKIIIAALL